MSPIYRDPEAARAAYLRSLSPEDRAAAERRFALDEQRRSWPEDLEPLACEIEELLVRDEGEDEPLLADLSASQIRALHALATGQNVFLTGVAGTGKTFLLKRFLDGLPEDRLVAVTASTGIAATHLGGGTIHAWAGIGRAERTAAQITRTDAWQTWTSPRIKHTDVLVIDEVSMLDGITLGLLDLVCRDARVATKPFGGLQVVLVGDLGQLPPVDANERGFPFEVPAWHDLDLARHELVEVHRQKDAPFAELLRHVRAGALTRDDRELLRARVGALDPEACVRVVTHNAQAEAANAQHLASLPGAAAEHVASDRAKHDDFLRSLDASCLSPARLILKAGARVMFTRNDRERRWVNGTLGVVTDPGVGGLAPKVRTDAGAELVVERDRWELTDGDEDVLASRRQYPLRLAKAITVHKTQGMTLDRVSLDLSGAFAAGQAYVALSRARSLEGVNLERWVADEAKLAPDPTVASFLAGTFRLDPDAPGVEEFLARRQRATKGAEA